MAATLGRFDEALQLDRKAVELDPLSATTYSNLGFDADYAGRVDEAILACKKALEINPEFSSAHYRIGLIHLQQNRPQEAMAEIEREPEPNLRVQGLALAYYALARKKDSDATLAELIAKYQAGSAFQIAELYAFRGESDRAFEWLKRAYTQRDGGLSSMKGDPLLKNIEHDPRYAAFLKKMHLQL